jgi:unsaturated rhamnogalacturonyl hydrolase
MEAYLEQYLIHYQPRHPYWNYEDGCVLTGCIRLYGVTRNPFYRNFAMHYLSERVAKDGTIPSFDESAYNIDGISCGKALFFALDETGETRYRKAADFLMHRLHSHPRCRCGSFWHKEIYPNQIWLDGLYMAQPFYLEYERRFNDLQNLPDIMGQFENVRRFLYDPAAGLFHHGYDEARVQPWCDPVTGCSPSFWLRSEGWYLMALADCIELLSCADAAVGCRLASMLREAADGLLSYADPDTGLFYQVIDRADLPGNYLETSGSAMAAFAFLKGARIGALPAERYLIAGQKAFDSLMKQKLRTIDGEEHLTDICAVAGLGPGAKRDGSAAYYLSEPVVSDDPKGVGATMTAYAESLRACRF